MARDPAGFPLFHYVQVCKVGQCATLALCHQCSRQNLGCNLQKVQRPAAPAAYPMQSPVGPPAPGIAQPSVLQQPG